MERPPTPVSFGVQVFEYLKTVTPHWRLCDEAWLLGEEHLVGIGVERNYGGQLVVVPWPDGGSMPHPAWPNIEPALMATGKAADRVIVVVDDRDSNAYGRQQTPFVEIPWSERERLKDYVVKDSPEQLQ